MSAPIVFLDTETTGVHPARQVWEIAMIRRDQAGQRETQFFVDVDLDQADPFGLSIGRFYERHPDGRRLSGRDVPQQFDLEVGAGAPVARAEAADTVARWTHGAHLVGAVPNFDTETLDPLLRAHGLIPAWHYHLADVENLAVGWLAGQRAAGMALRDEAGDLGQRWSSERLAGALGVDPPGAEERHTALGDARWAMRIWDTVMGTTPKEDAP